MKISTLALAALTVSAPLSAQVSAPQVAVDAPDGAWRVAAERRPDVKVAPHLGRDALWLRNNTHAVAATEAFTDGTIEFDWAPLPGCNFFAVQFRRESFTEHENIYFRPFKSGQFDSMQYAPRIGGMSTWQLYPGFNRPAEMHEDRWNHVRLEISGSRMEVYLADDAEPALVVDRLRSKAASGGISVWARINGQPDAWSAVVTNLEVRPREPGAGTQRPPLAEGVIEDWEISRAPTVAPKNSVEIPVEIPEVTAWISARPEEQGLVNLNRIYGRSREAQVAVARTLLPSAEARTVKLWVGYSDRVTVFLNGRPIYAAANGWNSRYPGYRGWVEAEHESVFLPLQAGENELIYVVEDDQRFGWGFSGRIEQNLAP